MHEEQVAIVNLHPFERRDSKASMARMWLRVREDERNRGLPKIRFTAIHKTLRKRPAPCVVLCR